MLAQVGQGEALIRKRRSKVLIAAVAPGSEDLLCAFLVRERTGWVAEPAIVLTERCQRGAIARVLLADRLL